MLPRGARLLACVAAAAAAIPLAFIAIAHGVVPKRSHPPKIIQLSYQESNDGSSPRRALQAFVRHTTDSVHFATRFHGNAATARARYRRNITDTDIHGRKARHPWQLVREGGGRRVLRLLHKSLERRGVARVRTRAIHGALRDVVRTRFVLSRCTQDPPLYPVSCEVRTTGR